MINFLKQLMCAILWHELQGEERGVCKRCKKVIIPVR